MLAEGRCSPTATTILSHRLVMRVTRESSAAIHQELAVPSHARRVAVREGAELPCR